MSLNPSFALAHRLCLHTERPQEVDERTMVKSIRPNLTLLPQRKADFIEPMDCAPVPKLIDGPEWVYEIKLDGYCAVGVKSDRGVNVLSRQHSHGFHNETFLAETRIRAPPSKVLGTVI